VEIEVGKQWSSRDLHCGGALGSGIQDGQLVLIAIKSYTDVISGLPIARNIAPTACRILLI